MPYQLGDSQTQPSRFEPGEVHTRSGSRHARLRASLSHARLAATSYRAMTAGIRGRSLLAPGKGRIFDRLSDVSTMIRRSSAETETCGVTTRYQAGGKSSGAAGARRALAERVAPKMKNGTSAPSGSASCISRSRDRPRPQSLLSTRRTVAASEDRRRGLRRREVLFKLIGSRAPPSLLEQARRLARRGCPRRTPPRRRSPRHPLRDTHHVGAIDQPKAVCSSWQRPRGGRGRAGKVELGRSGIPAIPPCLNSTD